MEASSQPSADAASTFGSELVSGLLGAGVAMACVLPPLLHLVTGPLGPLIGGFVAANRARPGARGRIIIAVTIGTAVSGLVGVAALVLMNLAGRSALPSWFPAPGMLGAIIAGVWAYATALGGVGTAVSAAFARKEPAS